MANIHKQTLIEHALGQLRQEMQGAIDAAQQAHDGATHEQSRAETQYDTLGLEHAYLAHGQSKRIDDLQTAIVRLENWQVADFQLEDEIYLGAIVTLLNPPSSTLTVFLTPAGGGIKVANHIQLLTPDSPLGQALLGLQVDDVCRLSNGQSYTITHVC